jgi:hypothetical protein
VSPSLLLSIINIALPGYYGAIENLPFPLIIGLSFITARHAILWYSYLSNIHTSKKLTCCFFFKDLAELKTVMFSKG